MVDGLKIAETIKKEDQQMYDLLTKINESASNGRRDSRDRLRKKRAPAARAKRFLLLLKIGSKKFRSLRSAFFFLVSSGAEACAVESAH